MRIKRTRFHIDGPDTVSATREIINDLGLMAKRRTEIISEGTPQAKPGPDIFGEDQWPDWEEVVARAMKKLDGRRHGGSDDLSRRFSEG